MCIRDRIDAVIAVSKNPYITVLELMENYIQGPDFPTGGYILGKSAIKKAYETGNGLIVMRAKTEIEEHKGRQRIVAYEIPYKVNKARLVEKIAHLARDKVVEGISDVRDESNREGIRTVSYTHLLLPYSIFILVKLFTIIGALSLSKEIHFLNVNFV